MTGKLMQIASNPAVFAVVSTNPVSVLTIQDGDWLSIVLFGVIVGGRVEERGGEFVLRTEHNGDILAKWLSGKTATLQHNPAMA